MLYQFTLRLFILLTKGIQTRYDICVIVARNRLAVSTNRPFSSLSLPSLLPSSICTYLICVLSICAERYLSTYERPTSTVFSDVTTSHRSLCVKMTSRIFFPTKPTDVSFVTRVVPLGPIPPSSFLLISPYSSNSLAGALALRTRDVRARTIISISVMTDIALYSLIMSVLLFFFFLNRIAI